MIGMAQTSFAETVEKETLTQVEQQTAEIALSGISRYFDEDGEFQLRINNVESLQLELCDKLIMSYGDNVYIKYAKIVVSLRIKHDIL
ncbi:TPA: hypothetical protein IQA22_001326 [Listeria monocytogenes]|nr:hypothetical protein [Listeria monocytogenes]